MRLEVGTGFSKTVGSKFREYPFSPRIRGEDAILVDVGKPFTAIRNYICADAQYLPFRNRVFEEVYASHLIEHLGSPTLFLREYYRILNPGGKIHLWCPNYLSPHAWADPTHKHSFNYHSLHRLLKNSGFAPSVDGHGSFLPKIFKKFLALISDELEAEGTRPV